MGEVVKMPRFRANLSLTESDRTRVDHEAEMNDEDPQGATWEGRACYPLTAAFLEAYTTAMQREVESMGGQLILKLDEWNRSTAACPMYIEGIDPGWSEEDDVVVRDRVHRLHEETLIAMGLM